MTSKIQWIAKAARRTVNGQITQDIGVGFAHRDGQGISLKFDMYPPDDERDIDIVVRHIGYNNSFIEGTCEDDRFDLCLVKEHNAGVNKWTKVGWAQRHRDMQGYTLHFNMYRVPQHQIHAGYNLAIRGDDNRHTCRTCGK